MSKPTLGYWDSRGVAEPIRLMLHYLEIDFEDKRYVLPDPLPNQPYDKSDFLKDKDNLGLLYPNLPYYIDGDVKVTQSLAIVRYLARKYDLMPKEDGHLIRAEILEQESRDFIKKFTTIFFHPSYDQAYQECLKRLPESLKYFSKVLGDSKWFVYPEKLSYVDFLIWETLDHYKILFAEQVNSHENLVQFSQRFEAIPSIKKYLNSDTFKNVRLYRFTSKYPRHEFTRD